MIDTANETICKVCGRPITQTGRGPRKRQYCSDACKERAYRERKAEPERQEWRQRWAGYSQVTQGVLEAILREAPEVLDLVIVAIEFERCKHQAIEVQNVQRIEQYAMATSLDYHKAQEQTAELEQELTRYRQVIDLSDRAKLQEQFMQVGDQVGYKRLLLHNIKPGPDEWKAFMESAADDLLASAIITARCFYDELTASGSDATQVATLEKRVRDLEGKLAAFQDITERFRNDTRKRAFAPWLEKRAQYYAESPFGTRFLADRRERLFPPQASRSEYERIMRHTLHYSEEDIETFREAWREMLKTQF